ncbi:MAG: 3-phosphoglycerate dehydrogenase [Candidatus Aminicenantes bacterium]|nr:3-phosphoglycerate dehydrogenase [Candidatus Aminicenantes bacterium]
MSKKVLVATSKPFAKEAVDSISMLAKEAGYQLVLLESYTQQQDLVNAVADVDAMIIRSDDVTAEVLANAKNLKIVVRAGAGYDNIDLKAAREKGVVAMNTPGQNSNAVAEVVFGLMLHLARRGYSGKSGTELKGKKLGIHAYGNVGVMVNKIAKGFDMEVFAYDPFVAKEKMTADGVTPVDAMAKLYETCDYVSIHLPKMKETIGLVNFDLMSKMKKGAAIINTAREEVVDEPSLLEMFGQRKDFFYAADVAPKCKDEIAAKYGDRSFFTAKKMGAQTEEANINAGIAAIKQIINFFRTGDTTFQVNK